MNNPPRLRQCDRAIARKLGTHARDGAMRCANRRGSSWKLGGLRVAQTSGTVTPGIEKSRGFLIEYHERIVVRNILPIALIMGALAGRVMGGYLDVVNVPVMEWAISLEEVADKSSGVADEHGFTVSSQAQRIFGPVGYAIFGVLFGAILTGLYHLIRRATPGWGIWAWSILAGLSGFWAMALLMQICYPPNPPGVGEESSLLLRQGFQLLLYATHLILVVGVCIALKFINESDSEGIQKGSYYLALVVLYLAVVSLVTVNFPSNPDPTPEWMPPVLVILYRTITLTGHFVFWITISLGVAGYIKYKEHGIKANKSSDNPN